MKEKELIHKICILGAGTWGIALARLLANKKYNVSAWAPNQESIDYLNKFHCHPKLEGCLIPSSIIFTTDMETSLKDADIIVIAVPSIYVRDTIKKAKQFINEKQIIVSVSKGIEEHTLYTMSEVIRSELNNETNLTNIIVALSGPTHAEEVAIDVPSSIVAACEQLEYAEFIQKVFSSKCMRVYTNFDIIGVEVCGAIKNIIALAVGMSSGLGYGDNTKAAIITRGNAEIVRLGLKMGCVEQTFSGLAGIGDLIVTATSMHSRNNMCGYLIGQGKSVDEAIQEIGMVVEGINALPAVLELSKRYEVEMPIVDAVNRIVNGKENIKKVVNSLIERDAKNELNKTQMEHHYEKQVLMDRGDLKMKRIITYGTFDLLHYGHINLLRRAKALGDYLIVVLSTDEFNWQEKKKKCYFTYEQRKALLEAIRYVDLVIPEENWDQKKSDMHEYRVDTFVIGDDWKGKFDYLKDEGVEVVYLPRTPEISTTQIKNDLHK